MNGSMATALRRGWLVAALGAALAGFGGPAAAQTYGLATMQPGTLANTVASAIAKTLKEKGGLNTLVQATAGESVLIPMVAKGEIDLGMANMLEVVEGIETGRLQNDLRIIGSIYVLRMGFFARKDSGIVNMADVKGKRVPAGYSAMRTLDKNTLAMLATANLTLNDVKPVMVPNVLRGGDDFMAGNNDMFMFSFGGPKVREADATVGGVRAVKVGENLEASRKIFPYGYFSDVRPIPAYVGVAEPMKVYAMDYILFTNAKMKDETVAKIIDTMANNKADMVATAPALNDFSLDTMHRKHDMTYHPGALKYFRDKKIEAKAY
ncbi:MAG: TAXI family TRAP transporter solute-binding subunit [Xanthobacteraceae bacterium]|nr:TAXI family TRAP transporter solute-binding subunit [Xanthobacteraceae bacterium]